MSTFLSVDQYRGRKNIVDRENGRKLGEEGLLEDVVVQNGQMYRSNSGMNTKCRIVQLTGDPAVTSVSPGTPVAFTADKYGTHIDETAVAAGGAVDGIVDPSIPKDLVGGDTFLLFTEGPCDVEVSAAVAGPAVQSAGAGKVATAVITDDGAFARTLEDGSGKVDTNTMRVYLQCEKLQSILV